MLVLIKDGENRGKSKPRGRNKNKFGFQTVEPEVKNR